MAAALFHDGVSHSAQLVDLSAAGAQLETTAQLAVGDQFGLGLHLMGEFRDAAGLDYLHFDLEVVEAIPGQVATHISRYRCRSLSPRGSAQMDRVGELVRENESSRRRRR